MDSDASSEDIERDYKKFSTTIQNSGYREGIDDESDRLYQPTFEAGHARGFLAGLQIGLVETLLRTDGGKTSGKNHCRICKDPSGTSDEPLSSLDEGQRVVNEAILNDHEAELRTKNVDVKVIRDIVDRAANKQSQNKEVL